MKHAFLIMAHRNPEQLIRLLSFFPRENCVCFVHIDKKSDIDCIALEEEAKRKDLNCVILKERLSGHLANWSLVEIELLLLRKAFEYGKQSGEEFDEYRLLSGQDYPIKSFAAYEEYIKAFYPQNYMNVAYYKDSEHVKDKYSRWRSNRVRDWLTESVTNKKVYRLLIAPVHAIEVLVTSICGTPYDAMEKEEFLAVAGQSWWGITAEFAKYVLEESGNYKKIEKIVRRTATPEETFFQALYVNSPYFNDGRTGSLVICNYGTHGEAVTGHTYLWRKEDIPEMLLPNCFFARKFDDSVDSEVLDELDKIIYSSNRKEQ